MTRRALLAALTGAALDPERLLWRPGKKLISIPRPRRLEREAWEEQRRFSTLEIFRVFRAPDGYGVSLGCGDE